MYYPPISTSPLGSTWSIYHGQFHCLIPKEGIVNVIFLGSQRQVHAYSIQSVPLRLRRVHPPYLSSGVKNILIVTLELKYQSPINLGGIINIYIIYAVCRSLPRGGT